LPARKVLAPQRSHTVTSIAFTSANWNMPVTVTFNTSRDSDKNANAGTIRLTSANVAPASVVVSVLDRDRSAKNATVAIASLLNGQSVSGIVAFTGKASTVTVGAYQMQLRLAQAWQFIAKGRPLSHTTSAA
jgi:hypothetical protein